MSDPFESADRAHTPYSDSDDSSSSSDSVFAPALWWDSSSDLNTMATPGPTSTTVTNTQLSDLITNELRNDHTKITGVLHYCGGRARHPDYPHLICETSARKWIETIESRTKNNWDDIGRIDLAIQYAIGGPQTAITVTLERLGATATWDSLKKAFLEIYPDGPIAEVLMKNLGKSERKTGETLQNFFVS